MQKINVGIIGGAGYTGGELIRLLIRHPYVSIAFVHSRSNAGKPVSSIHQDLVDETDLLFTDTIVFKNGSKKIDALFLCLGHGESAKFLAENPLPDQLKVIDLANDFRLKKDAKSKKRKFVSPKKEKPSPLLIQVEYEDYVQL